MISIQKRRLKIQICMWRASHPVCVTVWIITYDNGAYPMVATAPFAAFSNLSLSLSVSFARLCSCMCHCLSMTFEFDYMVNQKEFVCQWFHWLCDVSNVRCTFVCLPHAWRIAIHHSTDWYQNIICMFFNQSFTFVVQQFVAIIAASMEMFAVNREDIFFTHPLQNYYMHNAMLLRLQLQIGSVAKHYCFSLI